MTSDTTSSDNLMMSVTTRSASTSISPTTAPAAQLAAEGYRVLAAAQRTGQPRRQLADDVTGLTMLGAALTGQSPLARLTGSAGRASRDRPKPLTGLSAGSAGS